MRTLDGKIRDRSVRHAVIGLGYVGLPLGVAFAKKGVRVTGFDVDASKVEAVGAGRSYVPDVPSADLAAVVRDGTFAATTDTSALAAADVISICVPTPLSKSRDPDVSYVAAALESVRASLRPGQLIVLESTTYPGMTEEYLRPPLERGGLKVGRDVFLAFSPERVDPGNARFGVENTPKVVGGVDPESTRLAAAFYRIAVETVVEVSSAAAAEMAKLLENTFRSVNIALVNEVAIMCDRLGLDVREVVAAAASKPFGFMRFEPGPGTGGHCIPLDPLYLSWKLRTLEYRARFVELADDVNLSMPRYVVERVARGLNEERKSLKGARVLVLGVAYKRDVDDTRESPALEVIRHLRHGGAIVSYADPHVPTLEVAGERLEAVPVTPATLRAHDAVVVATDHRAFPWDVVAREARLVVDARGAVPRDLAEGTLWPLSGPALRRPRPSAPGASPSTGLGDSVPAARPKAGPAKAKKAAGPAAAPRRPAKGGEPSSSGGSARASKSSKPAARRTGRRTAGEASQRP
jgi:UDP-N-acetyl-D-glucosamine dehydrogenase